MNGEEVRELPLENETMLETVVLLSQQKDRIGGEIELDLTSAESPVGGHFASLYAQQKEDQRISGRTILWKAPEQNWVMEQMKL